MKNLRILLVDADPNRLENLASLLAEANHSVLPVNSAEEAEEALTIARIDVVLWGILSSEATLSSFVATLREVEQGQKNAPRARVFALPSDSSNAQRAGSLSVSSIDVYLPENLTFESLITAIEAAAQASAASGVTARHSVETELPVFEPEKFREQVAYDPELTVEIIDLFLEERDMEIPAMDDALRRSAFEVLSQIAHTIKGSLSSLHATRARQHAQELETAAKQHNYTLCREMLGMLAADLEMLEPLLLKLRDEFKP